MSDQITVYNECGDSSQTNLRKQAKDATGLTLEEKVEIENKTGWSREITDQLISKDEANIYINVGIPNPPKKPLREVKINGKACLVRSDIDLDQKDAYGVTNRELMAKGYAPVDAKGKKIELHHIGQKSDAGLVELTHSEHHKDGNDTVLHNKQKKTEVNRSKFAKERKGHWKDRYNESLNKPETS